MINNQFNEKYKRAFISSCIHNICNIKQKKLHLEEHYLIPFGQNWRLEILQIVYLIKFFENREFQDSFNVDIAAYDKDIANIDSERIPLEAKLEGNSYPRRTIISGFVKAKKAQVKGYQKEIAEKSAQYDEFEVVKADYKTPISVLTEAEKLLKSMLKPPHHLLKINKLNSPKKFQKNAFPFQKNIKESKQKLTNQIHAQICSYHVFFKSNLIIALFKSIHNIFVFYQVVYLFDRLINEDSYSLSLKNSLKTKKVKACNKTRKLLVIALTIAESELVNAESDFANVSDIIRQIEASLENANQRLKQLNKRRIDRWTECEKATKEYADARISQELILQLF
ncbi:unnamed protein product [Paramecium pentaurelia]|uniref:Uncharacterized protein n=1 Tax=Paramecium pentaurelia TaxID=43138 RepID=A0A8S1Y3G6_9CILI|nr:unnamed protein product [Paramecium pentaurelia]